MGGIDYGVLRDIQRQELSSPRLTRLNDDFYSQTIEFLSAKKDEAFSSNSILKIREYENLQKIVVSIKEKREEKIFLMALRGEKVNGSLTPEEKELFNELVFVLKKFRNEINDFDEDQEETRKEALKVKLIKDIEAYKGLDGSTYGPFKKDELVSLPKSEVDWLVKAKIAEMVVK